MKLQKLLGYGLVALGSNGCAVAPIDGGTIQDNQATFAGYAIEPGAPVRVQALKVTATPPDPRNGTWETLTPPTLRASATPNLGSYPKYDRAVYDWNASVQVSGGYFKDGRVTLRAQQRIGSSWVSMYSFDKLGTECLLERAAEAIEAGVPLNVQNTGIDCSRDVEGKDLDYVELAKPGQLPDLKPWGPPPWLVPDIYPTGVAVFHPEPGGPPAELPCGTSYINVAFYYENQGAAVMTQRRDRVRIPRLFLEEVDVQARLRVGEVSSSIDEGVLFPPEHSGRYASFDITSAAPNTIYSLVMELNYDRTVPESDYGNNESEVSFLLKCP